MKTFFKIISVCLFSLLLIGCVTYDSSTLDIKIKDGIDTVELNGVFVDAGAFATINETVMRRVKVVYNDVDVSSIGIYRIVYETTYQEVTKQAIRYVVVVDQQPPEIVINPGIDTIFKNGTWIDAGAIATDNSKTTPNIIVEGSVMTSILGTYVVTYTATDVYGNTSVAYRYVKVIDQPPALWISD
jgi:hypothetical protein